MFTRNMWWWEITPPSVPDSDPPEGRITVSNCRSRAGLCWIWSMRVSGRAASPLTRTTRVKSVEDMARPAGRSAPRCPLKRTAWSTSPMLTKIVNYTEASVNIRLQRKRSARPRRCALLSYSSGMVTICFREMLSRKRHKPLCPHQRQSITPLRAWRSWWTRSIG